MSPDRIVVEGSARREVEPDVATLRMAVIEIDPDRRAAFTRCAARVERTVPTLRAVVGGDGELTTGEVSLDRHYEPMEEEGPPRYAASCPLTVECAPAKAADVIAAAVGEGVDELTGPRHGVRRRDPLVEELLAEAVDVARRKAQRIGQAAGRRLGQVIEVQELGRGAPGIDFPEDFEGIRVAAGSASRIELEPAGVGVAVTVRVAFALGDSDDTEDGA